MSAADDVGFLAKFPKAIPGLILIVLTTVVIRLWVEPWMASAVVLDQKGWLIKVTHLNYILLGIIMGMLYRNVLFGGKLPEIFADGFRLSRLFIKTGIILLGSLYTLQAIVKLGAMAIFLIGGFVVLSLVMVLWLGKLFGMDRSMTGVMANACSICGVSAAVATAPAVEAKPAHVAYAIATVLGFGIVTMFISPFIGHALDLNDLQYGAWVGTGILNSGQVLAACLAFNPNVAPGTAVSVGEIWNIMRVISIPFAVFAVTIWYWAGHDNPEQRGQKSLTALLVEKFPVFVLGFLGMVLLTSTGAFGDVGIKGGPPASATIKMIRDWMQWIFGIGLVGLGGYIDFKEISQAGGAPLKVGLLVGVTKYILALLVVLLIRDYLVEI
jgi:uncharacterized integral membrane protein (TIGR00698 family)